MVIHDAHRFIYVAVPRTASTSIIRSLLQAFPDARSLGQHRMAIPKELQDANYTIIAGTRNPYERTVSHYRHRHRMHPRNVWHWSFHEYIDNLIAGRLGWWGLQDDPAAANWLQNTPVTDFLRYESLSKDWEELPLWEEIGRVPRLLHNNANPDTGRSWQSLYTREIAARVYEHQRADFDVFGYDPDSWERGFTADI